MSDTQARIDDLVKQNEVLLFMKGSASFPMCGRAAICLRHARTKFGLPVGAVPTLGHALNIAPRS